MTGFAARWLVVCAVAAAATSLMPAQARVITDMAGRKVTIPNRISRVYAAQPYTNVLLYMVAPEMMLGLQEANPPCGRMDRRFIRRDLMSLPWLTGVGSGGEQAQVNMETILKLRPDFVLATGGMMIDFRRTEERYARMHLPVVFVKLDKIDDYPRALEFLGKVVGHQARAKHLVAFATREFAQVRKMVAAIPQSKRVRVYYAESADGLATEASNSFHADPIRMAGGVLVHHGEIKTHMGMEMVSLEQVLLYNPEVIVAQEPDFVKFAYRDPRWKKIKAVANHRIYVVPRTPYDWIDRPPSVMRIIGVPWLAYRFYPSRYPGKIRTEVQDFQRLFMGIDVGKADLDQWLK